MARKHAYVRTLDSVEASDEVWRAALRGRWTSLAFYSASMSEEDIWNHARSSLSLGAGARLYRIVLPFVGLPKELPELAEFEQLSLVGIELGTEGARALAAGLKKTRNLSVLELRGGKLGTEGLKSLSLALKQVRQLTSLTLIDNDITSEGASFLATGLKKFDLLRFLRLGYNNIGDAGAEILAAEWKQFRQLKLLDLRYNKLTNLVAASLASGLKQLPHLMTLNLGGNRLGDAGVTILSTELKELRELVSIDLRYNHFGTEGTKSLAGGLSGSTKLVQLDLFGNHIGSDGASLLAAEWAIGGFPNLTSLDLGGNCTGISEEVLLSRAPRQIFAALRGEDLNEAKIVVLGEPNAGKTWLSKRVFMGQIPKGREETHDFLVFKSEWKPVVGEALRISLTVWDFGEQHVIHGVHEMFLTLRSIPLLVFDSTRTFDQNKGAYWIRLIRHFLGAGIPLVCVASKSREPATRLTRLDSQKLALDNRLESPIRVVHRFDVKDVQTVKELELRIVETLGLMDNLRERVSLLQRRVRDRVELEFESLDDNKRRRALIPRSTFDQWCFEEAAAIPDQEDAYAAFEPDALLRIVHNFGSLLYFGRTETEEQTFTREMHDIDAPDLKAMFSPGQLRWLRRRPVAVLNDWLVHPDWLKWPIYHLTRESEINYRRGRLAESDIDTVLDQHPSADFAVPNAGKSVVKEVLLLTELCTYDEREHTYLFPRGLATFDLRAAPDWYDPSREAEGELRWFFFPEAAFHRLIVRWYGKRNRERVWRDAIEIKDGEVIALVRSFPAEGRVTMDIHGGQPLFQSLLYHRLRCELIEDYIGNTPEQEKPWVASTVEFTEPTWDQIASSIRSHLTSDIQSYWDCLWRRWQRDHPSGPSQSSVHLGWVSTADLEAALGKSLDSSKVSRLKGKAEEQISTLAGRIPSTGQMFSIEAGRKGHHAGEQRLVVTVSRSPR